MSEASDWIEAPAIRRWQERVFRGVRHADAEPFAMSSLLRSARNRPDLIITEVLAREEIPGEYGPNRFRLRVRAEPVSKPLLDELLAGAAAVPSVTQALAESLAATGRPLLTEWDW